MKKLFCKEEYPGGSAGAKGCIETSVVRHYSKTMKKTFLLLGLIVCAVNLSCAFGEPSEGEPLRVMSYNIRFDTTRDGMNTWSLRSYMVSETIRLYAPDIFGVQEAYGRQVADIRRALPQYKAFGKGRDNGSGERSSIFYRTDLFELLDYNTLWLSETPEKSSKAWGAAFNRVVTWGAFRKKGNTDIFYVFNTHFDHKSERARKESAKLLLKLVDDFAGEHPCIVMGDFNSDPGSKPYALLRAGLMDSYLLAKNGPVGPAGTVIGFDGIGSPGRCIDHIFVKNDVDVVLHAVLSDNWNGRSPSDHRAVLADLLIGVPPLQTQISMERNWRFHTDPDQAGISLNYHADSFDDSRWDLVHAGLSWEEQLAKNYDGDAYYRKRVYVPETWTHSDKIVFTAGGIDDTFSLYINGTKMIHVGEADQSYWNKAVSIMLPRNAFRLGQTNTVVLLVEDRGGAGGLVGHPVKLTANPRRKITHYADSFRVFPVIEKQDCLLGGGSDRVARFDILPVQKSGRPEWFRFGIGHSVDDSGDEGLTYNVEDSKGNMLTNEFLRAKGTVWRDIPLFPRQNYKLIIEDADTNPTGKHPGNGVTVEGALYVEP